MTKINNINISRVLRTIWHNHRISRIEIARSLSLDKSTITKIVTSLLNKKLVRIIEEGESSPQGGRKPVFLGINEKYGIVIGLEIKPDSYTAVAVNLQGTVLARVSETVASFSDDFVSDFLYIVENVKQKVGHLGLPVLGIGVGLPGIINPYKGIIYQSLPLGIQSEIAFYDKLQDRLDSPILIENDARSCCWGEITFRKNQQNCNFLFVLGEFRKTAVRLQENRGPAVGLGLVINNKVLHGNTYSAGELKSVFWKEHNKSQFSIEDSKIRDAKSNKQLLELISDELSLNLALLINTINTTQVIIGGEFEDFSSILIPKIEAAIRKNWSYSIPVRCNIETSKMGQQAVAYGAAGMFLEQLFSLPEVTIENEEYLPGGIELFTKKSL